MTTRLGLWLLLAAAGWAFSFWVYTRRELPVRSRGALAFLRGAVLAVVFLLLVDPSLPAGGSGSREWVLWDVSSSMTVPQGEGAAPVPGEEARRHLSAGEGWVVATFGSPGERLRGGWNPLEGAEPGTARDSRLAPALTRALEGGASSVRILTDLRIEDPVEVEAVLRAAGAPITFVDLGSEVVNAGIASLGLPRAVRAGEEVSGEVALFGNGTGPVGLSLTVSGVPVWDTTVAFPDGGRLRIPVRFQAPDSAGPVPVTVRVAAEGDAHARDDARSEVLEVDPDAGELVLVSWLPDWEPRFLLPVLAEVTGLRAQGYLRVGSDRFMTMVGPVSFLSSNEVAAALEESRLAVVHGLPQDAPEIWTGARDRAPRLLELPGAAAPGGGPGEWYLSAELPPSALAGDLAGIPLLGLPPLLGWREGPERGAPVLTLQPGGRGDPVPALVLLERPAGRRAQALAHGFWRWAFREGEPRELYRRLWSGVAGWLLAGGGPALREVGIGPVVTVARPGDPLPWRAGPAAGGRLSVAFTPRDGSEQVIRLDSLAVDSLGRIEIPTPRDPGVYRWEARVVEGPGAAESGSGLLVAEDVDLDLLPPRAVHLPELVAPVEGDADEGGRRPLRTHPLPYVLLLGLLTAEWVLRRRSGLR